MEQAVPSHIVPPPPALLIRVINDFQWYSLVGVLFLWSGILFPTPLSFTSVKRICRLFVMIVQPIRSWIAFYMLQLRELEDKYAECMEMLHEAQEELKNLRNKTMPNAISRRYHSLGLFPMVSRFKKKTAHTRKQPTQGNVFVSDFQLQG